MGGGWGWRCGVEGGGPVKGSRMRFSQSACGGELLGGEVMRPLYNTRIGGARGGPVFFAPTSSGRPRLSGYPWFTEACIRLVELCPLAAAD